MSKGRTKAKTSDELFLVPKVSESESKKYSNAVKLPKKYRGELVTFKQIMKLLKK